MVGDPLFDSQDQLGLLEDLFFRDAGNNLAIGFDLFGLGQDCSGVFHRLGGKNDFRQVNDGGGDAVFLQQFLREAHGVESIRTGADRSDAGTFDTADDAADSGEFVELTVEFGTVNVAGMLLGHTVLDVALVEIVAQRDLAAEGIAAVLELHPVE